MIVVWDTETDRFAPGRMAPPLACVQYLTLESEDPLAPVSEIGRYPVRWSAPAIINRWQASEWARWALDQELLVGQNVSYDMAVLCAHDETLTDRVFQAYEENRVTDTMLRQKLCDIGRGKYRGFFGGKDGNAWIQLNYDLGAICRRHGGHANKDDPWRLHYGLLRDIPVQQWGDRVFEGVPCEEGKGKKRTTVLRTLSGADALSYALNDPVATAQAFLGQASRYDPALLVNEYDQARHFWSLDLASTWGLRTSPRGVESLRAGAQERLEHLKEFLGAYRFRCLESATCKVCQKGEFHPLVRENGKRDTKAAKARMVAVCAELGIEYRRTKKDGVCLDNDACNHVQDPLLEGYSEYSSMMKVLSSDVKQWARGIFEPIHTNFGLADSGRKTSASPNVQNPRRLAGVRECIVPTGFQSYDDDRAQRSAWLELAFSDEEDDSEDEAA